MDVTQNNTSNDNLKLQMFTDRSIYRPGQTVFYKGIVTMRNPKSGEAVVLNKENLKLPLLLKLFKGKIRKSLLEDAGVYIVDPFSRNADTIKIKASGGIRTFAFAKELIEAGADRIGCSSSIGIVAESKLN